MKGFQPEGETWEKRAEKGALMSVLDPSDKVGKKNKYMDYIHKKTLENSISKGVSKGLDFGCGVGRLTNWLGEYCDEVVGIDVTKEMIDKAQEIGRGNVSFVHYDGINLPFEDNSFDLVTSVWVLQHILDENDFKTVFKEIVRVLKPGGEFIFIEQVSQTARLPQFYEKHSQTNGMVIKESRPIRRWNSLSTWLTARFGRIIPVVAIPFLEKIEQILLYNGEKRIPAKGYFDWFFVFKKEI